MTKRQLSSLLIASLFFIATAFSPCYANANILTVSQPAAVWSSVSHAFTRTVESILDFFLEKNSAPVERPDQPEVVKTEAAPSAPHPDVVTTAELSAALSSINRSVGRDIYPPESSKVVQPATITNIYNTYMSNGSSQGLANSVSRSFAEVNSDISNAVTGGTTNFNGATLSVSGDSTFQGKTIFNDSVTFNGTTSIASLALGTSTIAALDTNILTVGTLSGLIFGTNGKIGTTSTSTLAINTNDLIEGLNLFFTADRSRNALSSSMAGITYSTSSGSFSLASGYNIPLTASTTAWENKVSSQWIASGSNLYYAAGNVGIGTSNPEAKLSIAGQNGATANIFSDASGFYDNFSIYIPDSQNSFNGPAELSLNPEEGFHVNVGYGKISLSSDGTLNITNTNLNRGVFNIDSSGIIAGDGSGLTGIATAFSAGGLESIGSGSVIDFDGTNWRTSSGGWSLSGGSTILGEDGSASFANGAVTIGPDGSFDAIAANGTNGELFLGNNPFIYLPSQNGSPSSMIGGVVFNHDPVTGDPIDLNADGSASFAQGQALIEQNGSATFGDITSTGGILNLTTSGNHIAADGSLAIDTPSGTSMFFGENGNIGIGTTSLAYKLTVVGDDGSGNVASFRTGTGSTSCTLNSSTGLLNCSSDERLKRDIAALDSSSTLSELLELNPVSYHWKTDESSSILKYGFIAQQVEGIFPELVATDRDSGYKTLSLNGMIPYIVSAIQELAHNMAGMSDYFRTKKIQTDELCVGAICVTQEQFVDMVQSRNSSGGFTPTSSDPASSPDAATSSEETSSVQPSLNEPTQDSSTTLPQEIPSGESNESSESSD